MSEEKQQKAKVNKPKSKRPPVRKQNIVKKTEKLKVISQKSSTLDRKIQKPDEDMSLQSAEFLMKLKKEFIRAGSNPNKETIDHIKKSVDSFIKKQKIEEFGVSGAKFDQRYHYAMVYMKKDNTDPNMVLEINTPGLKAGSKILKKCKVVVSK